MVFTDLSGDTYSCLLNKRINNFSLKLKKKKKKKKTVSKHSSATWEVRESNDRNIGKIRTVPEETLHPQTHLCHTARRQGSRAENVTRGPASAQEALPVN